MADIVPSSGRGLASMPEGTVMMPAEEMASDIITMSIKDDELPDAVLKAVMLGLAEEQQALKQLRQQLVADKDSKRDTSHISVKRGTLLKYMSETLLQRQALQGSTESIDLRGPKFREIFKFFLNVISETFDEIKVAPEYKELFFQSLSKNLEGWEEKAERILKVIEPPRIKIGD